ncbi:MAG: hypothetical protein LBG99_03235 [Propionibacteriaceae bacterium]|nr:hypothetical protein [Propionibacteriaceae bacterium]
MPYQALGYEPNQSVISTFGSLGLNTQPPDHELDPAWLQEVAEALVNGECDVPSRGDFAGTCMDDRLRSCGTDPLLPNLAGGALGLLFAARAVLPAYDRQTLTAASFMRILSDGGLPVYAHIDEEFVRGRATGCAFNDQIAFSGTALPRILTRAHEFFGFTAEPEVLDMITSLSERVHALTKVDEVTGMDSFDENPILRLNAVKEAGGIVEFYGGPHLSPGADISFRQHTTLARETLDSEHDARIFHLDAWSYRSTALKLAMVLPQSQAQIEAGVTSEDLVWQMATAMFLNSFSALAARSTPDSLLVVRP